MLSLRINFLNMVYFMKSEALSAFLYKDDLNISNSVLFAGLKGSLEL